MDKITNIGLDGIVTSIYDWGGFTTQEAFSKFAQKINIIIEHFNYIDSKVSSIDENTKAKLDYLLGEGLTEEVAKNILQKVNDGTLGKIINEILLKDINDKVDKVGSDLEVAKTELNQTMEESISNINNILNNKIAEVNKNVNDKMIEVDAKTEELETTVNDSLDTLRHEIDKKLNLVIYVSSVEEFKKAVTLTQNQPTIIYVKQGTYNFDEVIYLHSNTNVIGLGEVIFKSSQNAILTNYLDGSEIKYNGSENISIENIIFDGDNYMSGRTLLVFGHSKNIVIRNCKFKNLHMWHMIELNGCKDSIIEKCYFENYGTLGSNATEVIQLDLMFDAGSYPWTANYDFTTCENITIKECVFNNCNGACIGNHSYRQGYTHKNIKILNNKFDSCGTAIQVRDFERLIASDNVCTNSDNFFITHNVENAIKDILISNNIFIGKHISGEEAYDGRFVGINASTNNSKITLNVTITGNVVENVTGHGIGIWADNVVISNNQFRNVYRNAIFHWGGSIGTISNNIGYNCGQLAGANFIRVNGGSGQDSYLINITGNTGKTTSGNVYQIDTNAKQCLIVGNIGTITKSESNTSANNIDG